MVLSETLAQKPQIKVVTWIPEPEKPDGKPEEPLCFSIGWWRNTMNPFAVGITTKTGNQSYLLRNNEKNELHKGVLIPEPKKEMVYFKS